MLMPIPTWLQHQFPDFTRKLLGDLHFPDDRRETFFAEVRKACADEAEPITAVKAVIGRWQFRGNPVDIAAGEKLGRAHHLSCIEGALKLRRGLKGAALRTEMKKYAEVSNGARVEAVKKHFPEGPFRQVVWSFRNPDHPESPFTSLSIDLLPCRLGLDDSALDKTEYLFLQLDLPRNITVRRPTAMDLGADGYHIEELWEPGGRTKPRPACSAIVAEGLPEVLHESVSSAQIAPAFL